MKESMLKMNHLERYRQKGLVTKVIPNMKDDDSLILRLWTVEHGSLREVHGPTRLHYAKKTTKNLLFQICLPKFI